MALPVERGAASAFLPAVQDLARFFLSLTGSSSQGTVVGGADATVFASGAGIQLCPSAPGGEAATFGTASAASSLAAGPPSGVASVPGSSGHLWYCVGGFFSGGWASFRCCFRARFVRPMVACEGVLPLG